MNFNEKVNIFYSSNIINYNLIKVINSYCYTIIINIESYKNIFNIAFIKKYKPNEFNILVIEKPHDIKLFENTIHMNLNNYIDYYYITDKETNTSWIIDVKKIKYKNSIILNLMYLGNIKYKIILNVNN